MSTTHAKPKGLPIMPMVTPRNMHSRMIEYWFDRIEGRKARNRKAMAAFESQYDNEVTRAKMPAIPNTLAGNMGPGAMIMRA
jgi:hypothetical protein